MTQKPALAYLTYLKLEKSQNEEELERKTQTYLADRINQLLTFASNEDLSKLKPTLDSHNAFIAEQEVQVASDKADLIDDIKINAEHLIKILSVGYVRTDNPLFLWRIFSVCRAAQVPVPELVLSYLDLCAYQLFSLVHSVPLDKATSRAPGGQDLNGEACLKALRLDLKSNPFVVAKKEIALLLLLGDVQDEEKRNLMKNLPEEKARVDAIKTVHGQLQKALGNEAIGYTTLFKYYSSYKKSGCILPEA